MKDRTAALRQRRRRKRQRASLAVYHAEVNEAVFDALEAGGLLDDQTVDDRAAVTRALSKALVEWAAHKIRHA